MSLLSILDLGSCHMQLIFTPHFNLDPSISFLQKSEDHILGAFVVNYDTKENREKAKKEILSVLTGDHLDHIVSTIAFVNVAEKGHLPLAPFSSEKSPQG